MIAKLKRLKRGFTLVELMIVVAIVGILAALAIYGVTNYVKNAKTAEARDGLGRMAKDAVTAYAKEGMTSEVLALGSATGISNRLCDEATNNVPAGASPPAAQKYQSSPVEWMTGSSTDGWQCLKFSMSDPQYFQYRYKTDGDIAGGSGSFSTLAVGDLDGDAVTSLFFLQGKVAEDGGKKVAIYAPNLGEINASE